MILCASTDLTPCDRASVRHNTAALSERDLYDVSIVSTARASLR